MDSGSFRDALLDDADLVECREKMERSVPTAFIVPLVQHLNVSNDADFMGG